ncbi:hypothetical protein DL767_000690 [Monosporascus sp. MG133]|nr:hypothetical protein DL767_000690 [Monosporascus sp. MG133]
MQIFRSVLATFALYTALAEGFCRPSISCVIGGDSVCNNVCIRQGNPSGGRCLPRDGCPGHDICACYPRSKDKRDDAVIDGDEVINQVLKDVGLTDLPDKAETRDVSGVEAEAGDVSGVEAETRDVSGVEKRSICCSLLPPFKGLCCENHCAWIGKPGGQCSSKDICTCN